MSITEVKMENACIKAVAVVLCFCCEDLIMSMHKLATIWNYF